MVERGVATTDSHKTGKQQNETSVLPYQVPSSTYILVVKRKEFTEFQLRLRES